MMNRRIAVWSALSCVLALVATALMHGQVASGDEIRWGARPYTPRQPGTIRVRSDLVEIPVVVRDTNGAVVKGLVQGDFEVYDEGKKREISFFSMETAPGVIAKETAESPSPGAAPAPAAPAPARKPRYVAFYFDDFNMPPGDTNFSRDAAMQFVREGLEPGDKAGVFTSSTSVFQDFTEDKQRLLGALSVIRTHQRVPDEGPLACPHLTAYEAYLIMLNYNVHSDAFDLGIAEAIECGCPPPVPDCVLRAARETLALSEQFSDETLGIISDVILHLSKMPGRRMLVLASSGFMTQTNGPRRYQEKVIDAAVHEQIVINTLDAKGLWARPPGGDPSEGPSIVLAKRPDLLAYRDKLFEMQKDIDDDPLSAMAEGTGGRFFHNSNDLLHGFRELALEPEVSYVVGFSPEDIKPNGNLHNLKVKLVDRHGLTVQARRGYYAPTEKDVEEQAAATAKRDKLDKAVLANDSVADIPAEVSAQAVQLEGGAPGLKVVVHVDVKALPFEGRGGRNLEHLVFVTALFDASGKFLTGVEGLMELSLKDATREQLSTQGLDAKLSLAAPPGTYRLREVVEETGGGHLWASSKTVEIH